MRQILFGLSALAAICMVAGMTAGEAHAKKKGKCPSGFSIHVLSGKAHCRKTVPQTYRSYVSYKVCLPPGSYKTNDEVPSGSSKGRDRCTAVGFSGPALPCPIGKKLEIRKKKKDRCYTNKVRHVSTYADMSLIN